MDFIKRYWNLMVAFTGGPLAIVVWLLTPGVDPAFRAGLAVALLLIPAVIVLAAKVYEYNKREKDTTKKIVQIEKENEELKSKVDEKEKKIKVWRDDFHRAKADNESVSEQMRSMWSFILCLENKYEVRESYEKFKADYDRYAKQTIPGRKGKHK